jgi:dinuclear metal center YbgI/SA1388 family protein
MTTVAQILKALDSLAPPEYALPGDPIGLQVGNPQAEVRGCVIALDVGERSLRFALERNANVLITHHALLYHPVSRLLAGDPITECCRLALEHDIALICAHTNWDSAPGGISDTLARVLGLQNVSPLGAGTERPTYKLVTFLPEDAVDDVLDALAGIGCGVIGLYQRCAFYSPGWGTYEPQPGAKPLIGDVGRREVVNELRVEVLVPHRLRDSAVEALLQSHPYDEPAYDLYPRANKEKAYLGRWGDLPSPVPLHEFAKHVEEKLQARTTVWGRSEQILTRVAVAGGAGDSLWRDAREAGCQALVTGEVRHHNAIQAGASGMALIQAGHYATEQPGMASLLEKLRAQVPNVDFTLFEPPPGEQGRTLNA